MLSTGASGMCTQSLQYDANPSVEGLISNKYQTSYRAEMKWSVTQSYCHQNQRADCNFRKKADNSCLSQWLCCREGSTAQRFEVCITEDLNTTANLDKRARKSKHFFQRLKLVWHPKPSNHSLFLRMMSYSSSWKMLQ